MDIWRDLFGEISLVRGKSLWREGERWIFASQPLLNTVEGTRSRCRTVKLTPIALEEGM